MSVKCPWPCGNEPRIALRCAECRSEFAYCPEHGGEARAAIEIKSHVGGHSSFAKSLSCKWCAWRSEKFDPADEWATENAFDFQKTHAAQEHPKEYQALQEWLEVSSCLARGFDS